jgi:hypothetical protein
MPFNPTLPANGTVLQSAEMRGQLNELKALIDGLRADLTDAQATITSQPAQIEALQTRAMQMSRFPLNTLVLL